MPLVRPARQRAMQHDAPVVVRVLRSKGFGVGAGHQLVVGHVVEFRPNRLAVLVKRGIAKADRDHAVRRELHRARSAVEAAAVVGFDGRELGPSGGGFGVGHGLSLRAASMASAIM